MRIECDEALEAEIAHLDGLGFQELREIWRQRLGPPPEIASTDLTRRWLAYELQVPAYGGLKSETRRRLKQLYKAFKTNPTYTPTPTLGLKPGLVLTREWNGARHQVMVLEEGFAYGGENFRSLSEVARRITGSRWSGPLFFGLGGKAESRK
ncbi:MAG: DUF2924 domain-containing protein [Alphaproteobacteria bacterium]|nr:DUF2924 domain-containing protein [Alphaproteobacteria bacterium]